MVLALLVKNKLPLVDGSISPLTLNPLFTAWSRTNNVVISWLYNSVSKEIVGNILFATIAREFWEDLKTHFS